MAGIAIALDLLRKNRNWSCQTLHSSGLLSATLAASVAAASVAAGTPFASRALFGISGRSIAYCDAGAALTDDDYISGIKNASGNIFEHDSLQYHTKEYEIVIKPLFSAFGWKSIAITSLTSFLVCYLRFLEEDDDDFLQDASEEYHVDLIVPFKKSVIHIIRETTTVTTRRILERLVIHYASHRIAWKLLKDVRKSVVRKAERGMPKLVFFFHVNRTTFRGHFLVILSSWVVEVGIDVYGFFSHIFKEDSDRDQLQIVVKKTYANTVKGFASLVLASIGAGIGATLFQPSAGQWIGCFAGDVAGSVILPLCLKRFFSGDF